MTKKQQRLIFTLLAALVGLITTGTAVHDNTVKPVALSPVSSTEWYPLVKVVDGDTIDVRISSSTVRVRLIGLNTPEVVDPRKPVQCFGKEASAEMKKVTSTGFVRLETDPTQSTYDKYNRLLAYVYIPLNSKQEGLLVNRYMISEGYGHEYTYDMPYKYQADFKAAEKSARENEKGLWARNVCIGTPL